jgi:hypothetical protein
MNGNKTACEATYKIMFVSVDDVNDHKVSPSFFLKNNFSSLIEDVIKTNFVCRRLGGWEVI